MSPVSENPCVVLPWEMTGATVVLRYTAHGMTFSERIEFEESFELTTHRRVLLDMLSMASVVSYAKAFAPIEIDATQFSLPAPTAEMISALYDHGMREFAAHNNLDHETTFTLVGTTTSGTKSLALVNPQRPLIPMGGGRDSSVVATALRALDPVLLSIGHNPYVEEIADRLSLPLHTVIRHIDPQLLALNAQGSLNGHIPITAINSLIALLAADIYGCDCVVMANEKSASEPTRIVDGYVINHQYSKSFDFEQLLRNALAASNIDINYFSALRDRHDDDIAHAFAHSCTSLHSAFMSCNQAMLRDPEKRSKTWCGQCPKCRSVFLSLAPHLSPAQLTEIFGNDLLDDPFQVTGFKDLIDIEAKPYECVGEIASARNALMALHTMPEWKGHRVVVAIGEVSPIIDSTSSARQDHFIPEHFHRLMAEVFPS